MSAASAAAAACRSADLLLPDTGDARFGADSRERLPRTPPPPPPTPTLRLPDIESLPRLTAINRAGADMSFNAGYRAASAGDSWLDPMTGVRIVKLTDASFPAPGSAFACPYSEGGPYISRKWGDSHTVNVQGEGGMNYLIDVARSGGNSGRVSNPRPKVLSDVNSGFSYVAATPTRIYQVANTRLYAFDAVAPTTYLNLPFIPQEGKDFSAYMAGYSYLSWLTVTENDEWLVFQCEGAGVVIAYNLVDGTIRTKTWPDLNQPQAVRHVGDNNVLLCSNTYRKTGVWNYRLNTFIEHTHLYSGHPAPIRGGMVEFDPSFDDGVDCFTYEAATNTRTQRAVPNAVNAWTGLHKASHWINGTTQGDTWFQDTSEGVPQNTMAWSVDQGLVYKAVYSSLPFGFTSVGIAWVAQGPDGNGAPTSWTSTLSKVTSRAAMVEGSWFCDIATTTLYVWTFGGTSPVNVVSVFAAHGSGLGIVWHKGDGSDARLLCHSRCFIQGYRSNVMGTMSPDGLAVMFSSNMGLKTGRVDAYLALLSET